LRESLANYSREPFGDVLEALLQARPSTERMLAWARKDPAQWANAIKIFAILNGYTEKQEPIVHKHMHIHKMSDAELLATTQQMINNDPSLLQDLRDIHNREIVQIPNKKEDDDCILVDTSKDELANPFLD